MRESYRAAVGVVDPLPAGRKRRRHVRRLRASEVRGGVRGDPLLC